MPGLLITMEGTDGAGKSLQIKLLRGYLEEKGCEAVVVREPGGTDIGEKIRDIIIDDQNTDMDRMTEALLYAAARSQLVRMVIKPALEADKVVLCDRFLDSSLVYQGLARGIGTETVAAINSYAVDGLSPDITFFLDLPPEKGLARKKKGKQLDRIELESQNFHRKVYEGYQELAARYQARIYTIDASLTAEAIHAQIIEVVNRYL